jgi:acyl phosphate:glycerol-3-phosphate acyltransferase
MTYQWILFAFAAYLLGSFPSGKIIAWFVARIDITKRGSGNIGATNVARELGIKWGVITLLMDISKSLVPVLISKHYIGNEIWVFYIGLSALLGHQFSIFQFFKGGKGVATALGIYLGLSLSSLISCLLSLVVFVAVVYKWDFVSLGSMASALSISIILVIFGEPWLVVVGSFGMTFLVFLKHRENIQRLLKGEERKWREKGDQDKSSSSLSSSSSE